MPQTNILKYLINSVKPFKFYLGLHLFVVIYNAVDLSVWSYVSKVLIDQVVASPKANLFENVWLITLILIILTILPGFVWRIADYAWMQMTPAMKKMLTLQASDEMLKKSQNFYQNNFAGACANRVKDLANNTPKLIETILYTFINVFLTLTIAFFTLLNTHMFFAVGLILWSALFIFMAMKSAKLTDEMSADISTQQSKIMGNIVDVFTNIQNVKFFTNQKSEQKRIAEFADEYTRFSKRRNWFLLKFYNLHGLTFSLYFSISILALLYFYSHDKVTLGDFMLIFTINTWIINAMWTAANQLRVFLEDLGSTKQALKMINMPLEVKDEKDAKNLEIKGEGGIEIVFENVGFSYDSLGQPASQFKPLDFENFMSYSQNPSILEEKADFFENDSLVIKKGEKIGLVGHSGGGKSTFVNLILRGFNVNKGRILLDGQDIAKVTQDSLRAAISLVPQEPSLFHRTLYENIAYAKDGATKEEVVRAVEKSYCDKFIKRLPLQYDSLVGDRGVKLSGGQRQRIAIARAFLKNAPILIIDEGTSQLDSSTESLIQDSLKELMQNKTTIIIAHRLSTLQNVDRILVFDMGKIIEEGSHQELIAKNGAYKKLWEAQIGGFFDN